MFMNQAMLLQQLRGLTEKRFATPDPEDSNKAIFLIHFKQNIIEVSGDPDMFYFI